MSGSDSKVINDSDEFIPMPTPDQVVEQESAERLDPIPFQFNDIRALAQKILKRAQEQGQAKIEAARKQVAQMEKQAADKAYKEAFPKGQQEGYAKGEKEGMAEAEKKINAAIESEKESLRQNAEPVRNILEQLANIMNENRQQLLAQAEGDLLLLALDIAKRLVGHELSFDPEAIRPLAVEAMGLVTDRSAVTVRVNPEDYRVMEEIVPELKSIFPDAGALKIEADASIERGGIMAATRESEVDMRLATRLAAFEEAILGFSGQAAVAPWSTIPPEAIAAINRNESAYSLPPSESEPQEQEQEPQEPAQEQPPEPAEEAAQPEETEQPADEPQAESSPALEQPERSEEQPQAQEQQPEQEQPQEEAQESQPEAPQEEPPQEDTPMQTA